MTQRFLLFSLALLAGSSALVAQTRTSEFEAVGERTIDRTTQTEDVRFRNDGYDRMTVPVRLQGTGPYRFLVDTGADRTAISRDLARKLNLRSGDDASLHTVGGMSSVQTATVPALKLTRRDVRVVDAPLLESSHMGADGILGVDSLRSERVLFDFEGQTMSIVPSSSRDMAEERGSIVIKATRRNGRLVLTQARANNRRVTVVLDTGAQISIGNAALRKQLLGTRPVDPSSLIELTSVTGEKIHGECVYIREVEIGGVKLNDLGVVFAHAHAFKKLGLDTRPAMLLGMNGLRAFKRISIDFANKKFRVVLPEQSSRELRLAEAS